LTQQTSMIILTQCKIYLTPIIEVNMNTSYKEGTIWLSLAILLYIWFNYCSSLFELQSSHVLTTSTVNDLLLTTVIQTVFLEIILQVILAIIAHKESDLPDDERDKLISTYGYRNAYWILCLAPPVIIIHTVIWTLTDNLFASLSLPNEYVLMQIMIIFAIGAEIVRLVSQIYYYRKGF